MDLYDFAYAVASGVAQDTALQAWATDRFGLPVRVYFGMATDDLPGIDDAPFLVIEELERSGGSESRDVLYAMGCWMMVSNDGHEVLAEGNLTIPAGVQLIFDGMRLVRSAVDGSLTGGAVIQRYEQYADVNGNGAEVNGYMMFEFVQHLTMGQDPLD